MNGMQRGASSSHSTARPGAAMLVRLILAGLFCSGGRGAQDPLSSAEPDIGGSRGTPEAASNPTPASTSRPVLALTEAARTQRQQLRMLFLRYGDNETLSAEGFRRLLQSLGVEPSRTLQGHRHHPLPPPHHHHRHHHGERNPHQHHTSPPSHGGATCLRTAQPHAGHPREQQHHAESRTRRHSSSSAIEEELGGGTGQECLNASRLLLSHGISTKIHLTAAEFSYICPAIINQMDSKSCIVHAPEEKLSEAPPSSYSVQIAWIGGFIAISIISSLALLGIILVPLMNRVFFKFMLSFLVALAVGTLSGDAFLHLLPHSHAKRHHTEPFHAHAHIHGSAFEESPAHLDATWKGLTALAGLYFMFLVEHLITLVKQYKDKKQKHQKKTENDDDLQVKKQLTNCESHPSNDEEKLDTDVSVQLEGFPGPEMGDPSHLHAPQPIALEEEEEEFMIAQAHAEENYNEYVSRGCENKCHSHFHDTLGQSDDHLHHHHDYHHILHHHHHQNHHPHSHSQRYSREELKDAGITTLAWMVIMGDGLHNFSDGLAIGAAFTEGVSSGLSTSVAVFCHELPHELGDFAILLTAGMTVRQALLYNGLSAMLAYLGMITGILIGHYAENVSMWIFALTAGLFLYVALVDMVPEMLHNDASDHGCSRWGYFLLQNAGILLGFGIMLVISVFEHKIVFSINL
ncbi:zinc transporter ZIP6 isoform X1 [Ambystoma mexicanum]|uniref:zinc transporter ZIP6 isoform X1 n=1 Tax=Ambystoma mexicanum TaxID=8296 RepID=UPI0037E7864D